MYMKINLNIIKIIMIISMFITTMHAYTWVGDICEAAGCPGCESIKSKIINAADEIDKRHKKLERNVKKEYKKKVIPKLQMITKIQHKITHSVAHISALEQEANLDDKKLLFMLKQNQRLNTIDLGK